MSKFSIGDKVIKQSGKPFKSGSKVNTVSGHGLINLSSGTLPALTFEEDDSLVEERRCEIFCEMCENTGLMDEVHCIYCDQSIPHAKCGSDWIKKVKCDCQL